MDANDGYLSDVPTHRSMSPSEVSQDLVVSTKALEQHFKEKYSVLRNAYEDRIKRISETINATCKTLLSDEIIHEMKQDRVSSVFVLSHANEIIERHLESDREAYINQLLEKISQQDITIRNKNKEMMSLREKNIKLEKEQSEKASVSSSTISQLQNQLRLKIEECEKLRVLSEQREQDIDLLEQSFQQSAKELALIEGMDKKEQIVRAEMKEQLRIVSREKQFLQDENYDLRVKLQAAAEEIERLQQDREHRVKEEEMNHKRITQLMEQVEKTLEQEANESNLAISTVHDKMKIFRNRLVQELQKERKVNALLQEELMTIKTIKEDSIKDHRRLQEEEASLRSRIAQEQEKAAAAQQQAKTLTEQLTSYKLQLAEWENRYHNLEDKLSEQSKAFQQEIKLREETVRMETKKSCEQEQRVLEQKTAAFRLHYENEISKLSLSQQQYQNQQQSAPLDTLGLALEDFHLNEVIFRMRKDRDEMLDSHRRAMEEHRQTMETMRNELITRHQNELKTELRRQELDFKMKYEKKLADAQMLLVQAGQNIEKLKLMVKEGRAVITLQNQRMDHLKKEYDALQSTIITTSSTSRLKPSHRVAFGSTVSSSAPSSRHTTPVRGASDNNGSHFQRDKENHSLQSNVSILDNSTLSMSSGQKPATSQPPQPSILRTPQSLHNTTLLASADTPVLNSVHMTTPNNHVSISTPQQSLQTQLQQHQQTIQFLQSQLDAERQHIQQLEATVAQWQGEAEFYQRQVQQLSNENKALTQNINTASINNPTYSTNSANIGNNNNYNAQAATISTMSSAALDEFSQSMVMDQSKISTQTMMDTHLSSIRGVPSSTYENPVISGGYDRAQAMSIIEDAQQESRQAKMRCLELENVIVELRMQLEKAEKASQYLNEQLENPQSLTRQFGLLPKTESGVDLATNNNNKDKERAVKLEAREEDISTGGLTMTNMDDEHLEVPSINGLVQLQEKLEQSYAISRHWEERYQHQGELLTVAQQELQDEREKMQVLRKREHELFTLLTKVHQTYRQQIHSLRVELDKIKSVTQTFVPFAANEKLTTMNQIRYVFKNIFDVAVKKQEKDMKDLRIAMQTAHNTEISILESKFIEQVNALNQRHTKELEKMHDELLARTERALNASMTASAGVGLLVTPSTSMLDGSTISNASVLSSTQEISALLHPMNGSGSSSSTNGVKKIGELNAGVGPPAWESVLKGVLQGLRDQEAITSETTMKVTALGEAHQEPSFAANAAARALIGDDIDHFVVSILQKKYGNSPSTKDAAARLGKELGY